MIEDTIEVLKILSIFIASNRKYVQERKFPEKFFPLQENLLMRLQNATKSVDRLFESLNRIHDISSLNDLQKASSSYELIRLEDEIILILRELAFIKIRLKVLADEVFKEPLEKVELLEKIAVIEDVLKYFSKEKLSEQVSLQLKSSIENLISDTNIDETEIQRAIQQSTQIKPDFTYRVRFVSEYPNLSSLMVKDKKA
jgi:DNA-binding transcriptional ArsR family regulator